MVDTVDTAAFSSAADQTEKPRDARTVGLEDEREGREEEAREGREQEPREAEEVRSLSDLLKQLGGELSELSMSEVQLEAARNMPQVRRAARDVGGTLVVALAALTAFAFLNVAAFDGLSKELANWQAALLLAGVWAVVGGVLFFGVMRDARRWLTWLVLKAPPTEALEELERERDAAGKAAMSSLEQLGPALASQIALAAVPDAGDVASGILGAGDGVIEVSDEIVEVVTEQIPGGGVVNQVWDVALRPGRLGVKVATTVLRRARPGDLNRGGTGGTAAR